MQWRALRKRNGLHRRWLRQRAGLPCDLRASKRLRFGLVLQRRAAPELVCPRDNGLPACPWPMGSAMRTSQGIEQLGVRLRRWLRLLWHHADRRERVLHDSRLQARQRLSWRLVVRHRRSRTECGDGHSHLRAYAAGLLAATVLRAVHARPRLPAECRRPAAVLHQRQPGRGLLHDTLRRPDQLQTGRDVHRALEAVLAERPGSVVHARRRLPAEHAERRAALRLRSIGRRRFGRNHGPVRARMRKRRRLRFRPDAAVRRQ